MRSLWPLALVSAMGCQGLGAPTAHVANPSRQPPERIFVEAIDARPKVSTTADLQVVIVPIEHGEAAFSQPLAVDLPAGWESPRSTRVVIVPAVPSGARDQTPRVHSTTAAEPRLSEASLAPTHDADADVAQRLERIETAVEALTAKLQQVRVPMPAALAESEVLDDPELSYQVGYAK